MTALSPLRVGRVTGSRIAGILGLSPYSDRDSVLREMVRQRFGAAEEFTGNIATEYGVDNEAQAIADYERRNGGLTHSLQSVHVHPVHDFLMVTVDALVGDDGLVEAKCPYRAAYSHIDQRPDYEAQIRLQLACTGREWADFVVWRPDGLSVSRVTADGWLNAVLPNLCEFMAEYQTIVDDPELAAPFLEPLSEGRSDFDWQMAAIDYLEADAELKRVTELRDAARAALLALSPERDARGCGVQVIHAATKGTIDYRKAADDLLPGHDLEPYRKPAKVVTSVRRSAQ